VPRPVTESPCDTAFRFGGGLKSARALVQERVRLLRCEAFRRIGCRPALVDVRGAGGSLGVVGCVRGLRSWKGYVCYKNVTFTKSAARAQGRDRKKRASSTIACRDVIACERTNHVAAKTWGRCARPCVDHEWLRKTVTYREGVILACAAAVRTRVCADRSVLA